MAITTTTNTVTPPVATDNSKATAGSNDTGAAKAALGKDYQTFLKLLTTQLQNQDPTSPADTNQLTQQIATLSQVEQQINMNNNLQKLVTLYGATQTGNAVSYIGKQIDIDGNQGILQGADAGGVAPFIYNLPKAAKTAEIEIKSATGEVVFSGTGTTFAGRNQVLWDGVNSKTGKTMPDGVYTMSVKAVDNADKAMQGVTTLTTGIVKSVDTQNGVSTLSLGDISVALDKVLSVRIPSA